MNKIIIGVLVILSVCVLTACGNDKKGDMDQNDTTNTTESTTVGTDNNSINDDTTNDNDTLGDDVKDVGDGIMDGAEDVGDGIIDGAKDVTDGVGDALDDNGSNAVSYTHLQKKGCRYGYREVH